MHQMFMNGEIGAKCGNFAVDKTLMMMKRRKHLEDGTICEEKENDSLVPYLAVDIMINIFMRLPAWQLQNLRYACKEWYKLINIPRFIAFHLQQSKPSLMAIQENMILPLPGTQYVHPKIIRIKDKMVTFRSLQLTDRNFVENTCSGLVLLEDMDGNLSVSNPVTSQMLKLPPCIQRISSLDIKRGITFNNSTGETKVVSIVIWETGYLCCEMLTLGSGTRKFVISPFGPIFNCFFDGENSISIDGVFHVMLFGMDEAAVGEKSMHVVSFNTNEEKFYKSKLPQGCRLGLLHEIDGFPSIVVPNMKHRFCRWDVLILKDLYKGEWEKRNSIDLTLSGNKVPRCRFSSRVVASLENGRFLILKQDCGSKLKYFIYDSKQCQMSCLQLEPDMRYILRPHAESLVPL